MSENNSNAATPATPWFRDAEYFQTELEKRLAHQIGTAIMQGHMAEIRAGMEAGRADHVSGALDRLQDEVGELRQMLVESQKPSAGFQDAGAMRSPAPPKPRARRR